MYSIGYLGVSDMLGRVYVSPAWNLKTWYHPRMKATHTGIYNFKLGTNVLAEFDPLKYGICDTEVSSKI